MSQRVIDDVSDNDEHNLLVLKTILNYKNQRQLSHMS